MAREHERSVPDVLQDIAGNIQNIFRAELQLAKTEIRDEAAKASTSAATVAVGAILAAYALGLLLLALVAALSLHMPMWSAALCVGAFLVVAAILLIHRGLAGMKQITAGTERLLPSVKENVPWAKASIE